MKRRKFVTPYIWDWHRPTQDPGVLVKGTYGRETFVSEQHLRQVADALHNAADRIEEQQRRANT